MEALENLYFVDALIAIDYEERMPRASELDLDFGRYAKSDEDPLGEWIRLAKAKGETKDSDPVMLAILLDLHRKVNDLERLIKGETKEVFRLEKSGNIVQINYEHIKAESEIFEAGVQYYARVKMPVFPMREIPIFFEAISKSIGKIVAIHEHDKQAWDSYTASKERVMIRQKKGQK